VAVLHSSVISSAFQIFSDWTGVLQRSPSVLKMLGEEKGSTDFQKLSKLNWTRLSAT